MPDPRGFLAYSRQLPPSRDVRARLRDWREVSQRADQSLIREQATRCMGCGIPYCHQGCPLGNRIPDWNDLVRTGGWAAATEVLHATNNFPEFTGRLCPAPCEAACVVGLGDQPVTIRQVEVEVANWLADQGPLPPRPAPVPSGRSVAVVGSGPAGLAAAQQLARAGHRVTVYERSRAVGGLLRYGIPDFKLEKRHIDRRLTQLAAEGVQFVTGCHVGSDLAATELRARHDAVLLTCGALSPRDVPGTPGRSLAGIHQALEYLAGVNQMAAGTVPHLPVDAAGKRVVVVGGGDTAADCLGTAHRQGAASVHLIEVTPQPPARRDPTRDPWPTWPWILRHNSSHQEGGERLFSTAVREFVGDGQGQLRAVKLVEVVVSTEGGFTITEVPGTERELPAELALLAVGFTGTEPGPLLDQLGLARNRRGTLDCDDTWQTSLPGVFAAGDMRRGPSLVVWAIAEGRAAAAAIHDYLGCPGRLSAPILPTTTALRVPA